MSDSKKKVTFYLKEVLECPVCEMEFQKEEILSGGGRMNAGKLTEELHRHYQPTAKYGEVFPLIYPVTVCPRCFYAAFLKDFKSMKANLTILGNERDQRRKIVEDLIPSYDFKENRGLELGVASYMLAVMCYDHHPSDATPTFKQGLCCLRGAWLCKELHRKYPGDNWDYLALILYRKASFFYTRVIDLESTGKESLTAVGNLGPDIDKNYGYEGVLYLSGLLEFRYGQKSDPSLRANALRKSRSTVARIVGMGKSSKSKPSAILDMARDLHKEIKVELEQLGES